MVFSTQNIPKYCICLRSEKDRFPHLKEEFKRVGWKVEPFWGIDKDDLLLPGDLKISVGAYGCWDSHMRLYQLAKERGQKAIIVLESDVVFCDDFQKRIEYLEWNKFDCDYFALGGHFTGPDTMGSETEPYFGKYVYKLNHMAGTYAYFLTAPMYEYILQNTYNYQKPLDGFFADEVLSRFNSLAFIPFLASCVPNISSITGKYIDYPHVHWFFQKEAIDDINI